MGQCASREARGRKTWDDCRLSSVPSKTLQGCLAMAKERRSRFYIARRCLVMLLCWHKYGGLAPDDASPGWLSRGNNA